jgi:hypothetical protein
MGYSFDDTGGIVAWWLIDLNKVRTFEILKNTKYVIYPNGDGTAGKYIPISDLKTFGCIVAEHEPASLEGKRPVIDGKQLNYFQT